MILDEALQRRAVLGHEVLLAHVHDVVGLTAGELQKENKLFVVSEVSLK